VPHDLSVVRHRHDEAKIDSRLIMVGPKIGHWRRCYDGGGSTLKIQGVYKALILGDLESILLGHHHHQQQ